ncbi:MAG TPA: hypothetical protein VGS06_19100 [Streptosporangiaceae bacterium]|nr:hypothetical protein [Streptosporangiaceae bacterium]
MPVGTAIATAQATASRMIQAAVFPFTARPRVFDPTGHERQFPAFPDELVHELVRLAEVLGDLSWSRADACGSIPMTAVQCS